MQRSNADHSQIIGRGTGISSSVRRIFERGGGAGNFKMMKTRRKIFPLRISPFSFPKFGED